MQPQPKIQFRYKDQETLFTAKKRCEKNNWPINSILKWSDEPSRGRTWRLMAFDSFEDAIMEPNDFYRIECFSMFAGEWSLVTDEKELEEWGQ